MFIFNVLKVFSHYLGKYFFQSCHCQIRFPVSLPDISAIVQQLWHLKLACFGRPANSNMLYQSGDKKRKEAFWYLGQKCFLLATTFTFSNNQYAVAGYRK